MDNYIVSWFFSEDKNDESYYPQVGGKTSSNNFKNIYWKCILDFYYSSIINNNCKHMFFTNVDEIPEILDGINIKKFFYDNNIEIVNLNLTNKTPKNWFNAWRNQFYIFDILNYISLNLNKDDNVIILDSDCLIMKDLNNIFKTIKEYKCIAYDIKYPNDYNVNGITREDMKEIYNSIYKEKASNINYYGGEFIGVTVQTATLILEEYRNLWDKNYDLYKNGKKKLNEEAHFLSLIYTKLGLNNNKANKFIKRMWTSSKFSNLNENDKKLYIWHLPAEKKTGFIYFYKYIHLDRINKESLFEISSKLMGVPKKSISKKAKDLISKISYRIVNKNVF
ncbi:hypothetical protein GNF78_07525 [Clostridium perfringens]|uniref:hypothetical protein n=1 Tax=Clostridium perfringens TaxID=1502 RepID=UPI001A338285|nr:hypothetical protein [Clostridium perfringens]MDK0893274.1 hypothetical protein [Clostridium perfringens]MDT7984937.1 hypothetical protein [Clostridium perfringens]MDT8040350.1 hypothetical protein [Clostridium perfringens]MDZ5037223.1 hypothetical protein [Clostridium perfringens]HAT4169016.1 hypothetical protein [Clostridium perfringens]